MPLTIALKNLSKESLQELCREQIPEDEQLEFKQDLPSKSGRDPWYSSTDKIGAYARDKILAEVVAFANTRVDSY